VIDFAVNPDGEGNEAVGADVERGLASGVSFEPFRPSRENWENYRGWKGEAV